MDGVGEHIHRVPDEVDVGLLGLYSDDNNDDADDYDDTMMSDDRYEKQDLVQTPRSSGRGCAAQRELRRVLEISKKGERGTVV